MPIKVNFVAAKSLIEVEAEGLISDEDRCAAFSKVVWYAKRYQPNRALLRFERADDDISEASTFKAIKIIESELDSLMQIKWAAVVNERVLTMSMILARAFIRGAWIALFTDSSEASQWLFSGDQRPFWIPAH